MYAWNGCECSAPSSWFGAVPPAPMTVIGILNMPLRWWRTCSRSGREFRHAVDTKVCVHQLHDRPVSVHGFAQGFTDEVTFVDDFIRGSQSPERLLRVRRNVVRTRLVNPRNVIKHVGSLNISSKTAKLTASPMKYLAAYRTILSSPRFAFPTRLKCSGRRFSSSFLAPWPNPSPIRRCGK